MAFSTGMLPDTTTPTAADVRDLVELDRPTDRLSPRRLPVVLACLGFVLYAVWSILRHHAFQTSGYDLGIFEQAVRSYADGHWPVSELRGPGYPLLGEHFHPILATLAPLYWLWPAPETLLLAQSALLALAIVPVSRYAIAELGAARGAAVGAGSGLAFGLLSAVTFDFHEVCFAVPLVAFSVERLLRREWGAAVAFALPLLLVKEDLPMTVAAIGLYLVFQGKRVLGWATVLLGVVSTALLVTVVLPVISSTGGYLFGDRMASPSWFDGLGPKVFTLLVLLAPTAFVALRSPLIGLALPTLGWRMLSGYPAYWGPGFHYNAVLIPIVFLAAVDGLTRLTRVPLRQRARRALPVCAMAGAVCSVAALLPLERQPHWTAAEQAVARDVLARIPDGATVAAGNRLAPALTGRCQVLLFPQEPSTVQPEWVVVAKPMVDWPIPVARQEARLTELARTSYRTVVATDTVVLLRRKSTPAAGRLPAR
jgi:uncharacterized membrane protein